MTGNFLPRRARARARATQLRAHTQTVIDAQTERWALTEARARAAMQRGSNRTLQSALRPPSSFQAVSGPFPGSRQAVAKQFPSSPRAVRKQFLSKAVSKRRPGSGRATSTAVFKQPACSCHAALEQHAGRSRAVVWHDSNGCPSGFQLVAKQALRVPGSNQKTSKQCPSSSNADPKQYCCSS